jgi:hypothetical protein
MARISLIEPAQASPEVKEIYDGKLKGKPGSIQKALAHRPAMLGKFLDSMPAWDVRSIASCTRPCICASH